MVLKGAQYTTGLARSPQRWVPLSCQIERIPFRPGGRKCGEHYSYPTSHSFALFAVIHRLGIFYIAGWNFPVAPGVPAM
jgi:hypothetical protein